MSGASSGLSAVRSAGAVAYAAPRAAAFLVLLVLHVAKTMGKVTGPYAPFSGWAVLAFLVYVIVAGALDLYRRGRDRWDDWQTTRAWRRGPGRAYGGAPAPSLGGRPEPDGDDE